jgi:anti-sigma regulatory factor (Ser/Thr protein kinase)
MELERARASKPPGRGLGNATISSPGRRLVRIGTSWQARLRSFAGSFDRQEWGVEIRVEQHSVHPVTGPPVAITLGAAPESAALARRELTPLARAARVDLDGVLLAVSEAITSAVIHGYRGDAPGIIEVQARADSGGLTVTVTDRGVGMSPNPESPGIGLGVPLMIRFADRVTFDAVAGGGTRVTMRFDARST